MHNASPDQVTLANCENEPIHTPGSIQPHGALVALAADGRVLSRSQNFAEHLGTDAQPGHPLPAVLLSQLGELVEAGLGASEGWGDSARCGEGEASFDVIAHRFKNVIYLEFEPQPLPENAFHHLAGDAQRIISRIRHARDTEALLRRVTAGIHELTGYDRVMAYRFRPDDSGEVVAEAHRPGLVSYLGQRYPASDIPSQARRLYIQNPTRLIAEVTYDPSPLIPAMHPETGQPFDLSYCELRSVSPIHCEYLNNMGVRGSMSVSIVVGGKLWGLFSCHHQTSKQLAYSVRLSFQMVSQICAALVERLEQIQEGEAINLAQTRIHALEEGLHDAGDLIAALCQASPGLDQLVECEDVAVCLKGRVQTLNGIADDAARQMQSHLSMLSDHDLYAVNRWPGSAPVNGLCGVLAVRFDRRKNGWIMWFRPEQVENVRWGGKPEKIVDTGPSGPRLTPRGSFEAWEEVVRGQAVPWSRIERNVAERLRQAIANVMFHRVSNTDSMRQMLIAALGHDLRTPLQSITMAASMLSDNEQRTARLRQAIATSTGRMSRLVSHVMELSRLQAGLGMALARVPTDVSALLGDLANEAELAYPGLSLERDITPGIQANVDPDRLAQVVINLIGNASQHGVGNRARLSLSAGPKEVLLTVANPAPPMSEHRLQNLFAPFKGTTSQQGNRDGLGLGLYISDAIARAHGGSIRAEQGEGEVRFTVRIAV
ncbi:ATP-binding protein [Pseudomonas sp. RIT-PI-S]|uniref:ATP-binding protein n=1 Tax=Pseudomonas sp. RIT-PI-S TaxID=3035295 RepID=UPI0021D9E36F|nr:ATP-binding protein [Pseudomonas sp. RIT-PI-S]